MEYNITSKNQTSEQCFNSKHDLVRCNKIWQYFKARLHIIYINSKPPFLGCKGRSGGRSYGDGTRSKLVGQSHSFLAIFFSLQKYADVLENTLISQESLF